MVLPALELLHAVIEWQVTLKLSRAPKQCFVDLNDVHIACATAYTMSKICDVLLPEMTNRVRREAAICWRCCHITRSGERATYQGESL
jgi:hypothetical protein